MTKEFKRRVSSGEGEVTRLWHVKMRREAKGMVGFIFTGDSGSDDTVC